jgi:hypothetical protein
MSGLMTNDEQIKVTKSPFAAYENESAKYDGQLKNVRFDDVATLVKRNHIIAVDFVILEAVAELEFATSRMVTQFLNMRNIEIEQERVHNRLKFLNKHKVVQRYYFSTPESDTNTRIYCLEKHGKTLLLGRNYPCRWKPTDSLRVDTMKEILSRNQILMAFREKVSNLSVYDTTPSVKLLKTTNYFKPHLKVVLDLKGKKEEIFFEVVRSYENYANNFIERLKQYQEYYEYWQPSAEVTEPPKFIILAEDSKHAFAIYKTILQANISLKNMGFIFNCDTRIFDRSFNESFFKFDLKNENGKSKAVITELNYASIELIK